MRKLKLDLDTVVVESFATAGGPRERGTVAGRENTEASHGFGYDSCTADGCSVDMNCSWNSDCSIIQCSDACTGYPGCSEDDNCSQLERCTGLKVCFWTP